MGCYVNGSSFTAAVAEQIMDDLIDGIISGRKNITDVSLDMEEYNRRREFRRMDRFSILSLLCFAELVQNIDKDAYRDDEIATVLNTTFGPIETTIDFADSIKGEDKESASPIIFSHTVNNAALGHVCKRFQLKGPSTLVLSSNSIAIAQGILDSRKAGIVLSCGAEQYSTDMSEYLKAMGIFQTEAAAALLLSGQRTEETQSRIVDYREVNLFTAPCFGYDTAIFEKIQYNIMKVLADNLVDREKVEYIFASSFEEMKFLEPLHEECKIIDLKDSIGETLGASLHSGILFASYMFRRELVDREKYILINNIDVSGNFVSFIIGSAIGKENQCL